MTYIINMSEGNHMRVFPLDVHYVQFVVMNLYAL